jgi:hypothetical protein
MGHLLVEGIVAARDKEPYVVLSNEKGRVWQLSVAEARKLAMDILQMAARTEADAMIIKFFEAQEFPAGAAGHLLVDFRDFRLRLDNQPVEGTVVDPDTGDLRQSDELNLPPGTGKNAKPV